MEKAFDRCSWEYLRSTLDKLGLGETDEQAQAAGAGHPAHEQPHANTFTSFFDLAYSAGNPPRRRLYVNGYLGPEFSIHCGVAQGCPCSPLLFLCITEALSRLVLQDEHIRGIAVGTPTGSNPDEWIDMQSEPPVNTGWQRVSIPQVEAALAAEAPPETWAAIAVPTLEHGQYIQVGERFFRPSADRFRVHKLSQFADDSTLLAHPTDIPRFNTHLQTWCDASAMKENDTKREGMLLGGLRRRPEDAPTGVVPDDQYLAEGDYLISLGVPFGNDFDETEWWLARYRVVKKRVASWRSTAHLTIVGRMAAVQAIYLGSFRYWLFTMELPESVSKLMEADVKELLWAHSPHLNSDELGTEQKSRRYVHEAASYLPRKGGGVGAMHWPSHVKAFKAHWIRRYLDPREGPWKQVVDYYVADVNIRRAIVVAKLSDGSPRCVHADLPHKATHLRACFKAFEELRVEQDTSSVGPHIAGEPLWLNWRFTAAPGIEERSVRRNWQGTLNTWRLCDLVGDDGVPFSREDWENFAVSMKPPNSLGNQASAEWVHRRGEEADALMASVPTPLLDAVASEHAAYEPGDIVAVSIDETWRYGRWLKGEGDQGVLAELWLDLSRKPHMTGRLLPADWALHTHCPAAVWSESREPWHREENEGEYRGEDDDEADRPDTAIEERTMVTEERVQGPGILVYPRNEGWHFRGCFKPDQRPGRLSDLTMCSYTV
jgi:hypothetical protein